MYWWLAYGSFRTSFKVPCMSILGSAAAVGQATREHCRSILHLEFSTEHNMRYSSVLRLFPEVQHPDNMGQPLERHLP